MFIIWTDYKRGIKCNYSNLIKGTYENSRANIIPSQETQSFLPKIRNKTGLTSSLQLFYIVLEVLARIIMHEGKRDTLNWKARGQTVYLFADEMTEHTDNSKESTHKHTKIKGSTQIQSGRI